MLRNMAIETVDLAIKKGDFPSFFSIVYQVRTVISFDKGGAWSGSRDVFRRPGPVFFGGATKKWWISMGISLGNMES